MFILFFPPAATGWLGKLAFDRELIIDEPTRRHKGKWVRIAARAESAVRSNRCSRVVIRAGQRNRWRIETRRLASECKRMHSLGFDSRPRYSPAVKGFSAGEPLPADSPGRSGVGGVLKGAAMTTRITYCDLADSWVARLPSGGELWSDSRADLQAAVDAIEEVQTVRRENTGIVLGCILAAVVLGLAAIAAAFISG